MDCSPPGYSVMGFSGLKNTVGCRAFLRGSCQPKIERVSLLSPALWGRFLTTSVPPGRPVAGGGNMPEELGAGRKNLTGHFKLVSLPEPVKHFLTLTVSAGPPEQPREAYLTQSLTHIRNWPFLPFLPPLLACSLPHLCSPSLMKGRQAEGIWWRSGRLCSLCKSKLQAVK